MWAFITGGATLERETENFWRRLGYAVIQGYGMTETASLTSLSHPFRIRQGSIGKPVAGQEVKLNDDGEILVRGKNVSPGYWKRNGQTLADESIAGAGNDYSYQGCPDGIDLLYRLTLPAPQQFMITITPTFNGSISWSSTTCPPMLAGGTCVSYSQGSTYMRMVPAGPTTLYIMIERTTGTGSTFSLAVQ